MGVLSSLVMRTGIKGIGMAASAAGSVVGAAGSLASGLASGIGNAVNSMNDEESTTNTVINNVGIVGTAGTQKVKSGVGTLPAPKKAATPAYNEKMPTEKLLSVAVGYLASIDTTLRSQIENDRLIYQKQVQAEKEVLIEDKTSVFGNLGDKLSGVMDKKPSSSVANKLLLGAGLITALGAIGINNLDTSELDALKENVAAFTQEYSWLVDMASFIGVGGFIGFLRGGVKGGLVGIVAEYVFDKLWNSSLNPFGPKDENGNPILQETSAAKGALMAGVGAFGLRRNLTDLRARNMRALEIRTRPNYASMSGSARRAAAATGARRGTAWFSSRAGRRFLVILGRRLGPAMMRRIAGALAGIVGGFLLTGTGIGAIPGIAMAIFNAGLLIYGIYDIATAIWEAYQDWKNTRNADEGGTTPNVNAVEASGETVTGAPVSIGGPASTIGQESFIPSGDQKVDFAMQYLMQNLGLKQFQAAGIVANLMAESGLDTNAFNEAGGGRGAYGIAQWRGPRQDGLDAFAAARSKRRDDFETQLAWLVEEMKTTHRDTLPAMLATTSSADATTVFLDKFERPSAADRASSLQKRISFGMAAERGTSMATAQSTYSEPASLAAQSGSASSGAGSITSMLEMGKKIFGAAGGALLGTDNYTMRPLNQNIGMPSNTINDLSRQIETQTIAGNIQQQAQTSTSLAATAGQRSIMQASNDGSLGALDPNYPSGNDLIRTYLAHWKFAA